MRCPFCRTENRNERDTCCYCEKDLSMLRLIVNKARSHFNTALELAERNRNEEAIAELHNALDLDHSHINSHVVLGTLYVKTGDLEKAQACWEEALALDPRLQKAHEYLQKGQTAARTFPICLRQRKIIVFLSLLLVAVGALFAVSSLHAPYHRNLGTAWKSYENRHYSQALEMLDQVAPESALGSQADALRGIILREQDLQIRTAQQFLKQGDFREADKTLTDLLDREPSPSIGGRAKGLRATATQRAREAVTQALENYKSRRESLDAVQKTFQAYRSLSRVRKDDPFLVSGESALTSITRTLRVEDALTKFQKQEIGEWGLLENLVEIRREYPDFDTLLKMIRDFSEPMEQRWLGQTEASFLAGRFEETVQSLKNLERLYATLEPNRTREPVVRFDPETETMDGPAVLAKMIALAAAYGIETLDGPIQSFRKQLEGERVREVETALNTNRLEEAEAAIERLDHLWTLVAPEQTAERVGPYRATLEEKRTIALEQKIRAAYKAENDEETVALGEKLLESKLLDEERRQLIEAQVSKANERLAKKRWLWVLERDRRYIDGTVSLPDAETTVAIYPQVAKHLSRKVYPAAQDNLLLYLALSYRQVGQTDKADQALERIEKEYPNSDVLGWVKTFKSRKEKETESPK